MNEIGSIQTQAGEVPAPLSLAQRIGELEVQVKNLQEARDELWESVAALENALIQTNARVG